VLSGFRFELPQLAEQVLHMRRRRRQRRDVLGFSPGRAEATQDVGGKPAGGLLSHLHASGMQKPDAPFLRLSPGAAERSQP
jgi:hypothetical protein